MTTVEYLPSFSTRTGNRVFALVGSRFPAGSLKWASVQGMLAHLRSTRGLSVIKNLVASTSGNTGIAAATALRNTGARFHAVVDPRTAPGKLEELRELGASVIVVERPSPTWIDARLKRTAELVDTLPNAVDLDQYTNPGALKGHFTFTGPMIWQEMSGKLDVFVAPIGTGGTIGGISYYLRAMDPKVKILAVDCVGSIVLGGTPGPHIITGMGAHIRCLNAYRAYPALVGASPKIISDAEGIREAHWIRKHDGLWVGGSSGAALAAVAALSRTTQGKTIVVALPDGGESYEHTIFDTAWLAGHGVSIEPNTKGELYGN